VDDQSVGFQFHNSIGLAMDDLKKQGQRIGDNNYLPTSVITDLDVFYLFDLPGSYTFSKEDGDNTPFSFTPPTVSGIKDNVSYAVTVASGNNIETFWYDTIPDRVSLGDTVTGPHLIASGLAYKGPLGIIPASGLLHTPNQLTIRVTSGVSYIGLYDDGTVRKGLLQLTGTTRAGLEVEEEIVMIHDDTVQSIHEYKSLESVNMYGLTATTALIEVFSGRFGMADYQLAYNETLDRHKFSKEERPLFWSIDSGNDVGQFNLNLLEYEVESLALRLDGFIDKKIALQQQLQDIHGASISPLDLAVEPHSDNLYVVSSGTLFVYDVDLPYPDLSSLSGKDYGAAAIIEPNTYYAVSGDDIELDYFWRRPTTGLVKHRVWVDKPDGTQFSIEDGVEVAYHIDSSSWIFGEPVSRQLRPTDIFTLDQQGDYVYSLEVVYTDGTTTIDKRVISVLSKKARAQYNLTELGLNTPITGVDFDSEYKLWVLDEDGDKHQIDFHYDNMIIDTEKKVIYFRENYDQVRVF
jgi:hypothetical protein